MSMPGTGREHAASHPVKMDGMSESHRTGRPNRGDKGQLLSYKTRHGRAVVLLLTGGDKSSQQVDIKRAKELWAEWKRSLGAVAAEAGISRESLYRALSPKGNPTLKTLLAVLKTVGLRLSVEPETRNHA
jgi:DNA-binding phage protein